MNSSSLERHPRVRVVAAAVAAMLITGALVACGGQSAAKGVVTLTVDYVPDPANVQSFFTKEFADFEKKNPKIRVKAVPIPRDQFPNTIGLQFQQGNSPDVFQLQRGTRLVDRASSQGWLHSLDQWFTSSLKADLSKRISPDLFNAKTSDAMRGGHVIGTPLDVPIYGATWALYYNKDVLEKYGITSPPTSWSELAADATKISKDSNKKVYGFSPYGKVINQNVDAVQWNTGDPVITTAQGLNLKTGQPGFAQQNYVDAVKYYSDLDQAGVFPPGWETRDDKATFPLVAAGKVAMVMGIAANYKAIKQLNPKLNLAFAPVPTPSGTGTARLYTLANSAAFWGMSSKTKHPEEAWKLMDFMLSSDFMSGYAKATGLPVGDTAASDTDAATKELVSLGDKEVINAPNPHVNPATSTLLNDLGTALTVKDIQSAIVSAISSHKSWAGEGKKLDDEVRAALAKSVAALKSKGQQVSDTSLSYPDWDVTENYH